jgi:hypothetical protein
MSVLSKQRKIAAHLAALPFLGFSLVVLRPQILRSLSCPSKVARAVRLHCQWLDNPNTVDALGPPILLALSVKLI